MKPETLKLSPRERQTLELMAEGLSSKLIAAELGLSVATVRGYRETLFLKLRVNNCAAAIAVFFRVICRGKYSRGK